MSELTEAGLKTLILEIKNFMEEADEKIALQPTKLIIRYADIGGFGDPTARYPDEYAHKT